MAFTSVETFKLGLHHNTDVVGGYYLPKVADIGSVSDVYSPTRGPSGYVATGAIQYDFLKAKPNRGDSYLNPANRAIARANDRDLQKRLNQSINILGTTQKQIRINEKTRSGTSEPATTQFNYTTDYFQARAGQIQNAVTEKLSDPMNFWGVTALIIVLLYTFLSKRAL